MKRYICRNIIVVTVFLILIIHMDIDKYEGLKMPWIYIDYMPVYLGFLMLFMISSFSYKLNKNNQEGFFYIKLIFTFFLLITKKLPAIMMILTFLILLSAYMVNKTYKNNKLAGCLHLPYLIFVSYLLVMNQAIIFIN